MLRSWARFQRLPLGGYQTVREDHPARRLVFRWHRSAGPGPGGSPPALPRASASYGLPRHQLTRRESRPALTLIPWPHPRHRPVPAESPSAATDPSSAQPGQPARERPRLHQLAARRRHAGVAPGWLFCFLLAPGLPTRSVTPAPAHGRSERGVNARRIRGAAARVPPAPGPQALPAALLPHRCGCLTWRCRR